MQKLITLSIIATMTGLCYSADPEVFLKQQKAAYFARVEKADKAAEAAKKNREQEVLAATKAYIKDLEKVKIYWTKKGKLEKAMEFKKQIDELQKLGKVKPKLPLDDIQEVEPVKHNSVVGRTFRYYCNPTQWQQDVRFTLQTGGRIRANGEATSKYWKLKDGWLLILDKDRKEKLRFRPISNDKEGMILCAHLYGGNNRSPHAMVELK